jgi:hypothetical protein
MIPKRPYSSERHTGEKDNIRKTLPPLDERLTTGLGEKPKHSPSPRDKKRNVREHVKTVRDSEEGPLVGKVVVTNAKRDPRGKAKGN